MMNLVCWFEIIENMANTYCLFFLVDFAMLDSSKKKNNWIALAEVKVEGGSVL